MRGPEYQSRAAASLHLEELMHAAHRQQKQSYMNAEQIKGLSVMLAEATDFFDIETS